MPSELILHAGRIAPQLGAPAPAVLCKDGQIFAGGDLAELRALAPYAEIVDVGDSVILPGFVDTHTHFFELARRRAGVDLSGAGDLDELRARLRKHRQNLPPDQLWIGGSGWDRNLYPTLEGFDRSLLDQVFPDHPVALEARDFHTLWCNTRALEEAGVMAGAEAPAGGEIGRHPDGSPDGFLYETAWDLIWKARPVEPQELRARWVKETIAHAHSLGLTGFHSMELDAAFTTYGGLAERDELKIRVCFHSPLASLDERIAAGFASYAGANAFLRRGGVKIFMDGSLGSRSAYMREAYPDGGHGRLLMAAEELQEIIVKAGRASISPSIHAIGDATVSLVLDALAAATQRLAAEGHSLALARMEHAQCVRPEDVLRLGELGVFCAMQPVHLADDIPLMPQLWPEAGRHAYPIRSLLDAGVAIGLGSDAPVADIDPRRGIFMAVQRRFEGDSTARAWHPEQSISLAEALHGYTGGAARAALWESDLGSVEMGKRADLIAFELSDEAGVEAVSQGRVRLTVVDGEIVYDDLASP